MILPDPTVGSLQPTHHHMNPDALASLWFGPRGSVTHAFSAPVAAQVFDFDYEEQLH